MLKDYLQKVRLIQRDMRLFLGVNFIVTGCYVGMYVLLFNLYVVRLGYGVEFLGLVNAVSQLGVAGFSLVAGMMGQRWGSRRMVIIGLSIVTFGLFTLPLAEFLPPMLGTVWLVVAYLIAWLGGTLFMVNSVPYTMSATTQKERAHAFSLREAIVPLAVFFGSLAGGMLPGLLLPLVGGTLDDPAPYRYGLMIAGGLFGLAPLMMSFTAPIQSAPSAKASKAASSAGKTAVSQTAPYKIILFISLIILLQMVSRNLFDTFYSVYLDIGLSLSPSLIGSLAASAQFLATPLALMAPLVLAKLGQRWTIIAGAIGMAFSIWIMVFIPHWAGAGIALLANSALFAIANPVLMIYSQEQVEEKWRATMSGAITMAGGFGRAGISVGGGYIITAMGFPTLFLIGGAITVAGALLFWTYSWRPRRTKQLQPQLEATL